MGAEELSRPPGELAEAAARLDCVVPDSLALAASGAGVLSGRSFLAKDLFAVAGHTSSFGHARWRETHAPSRTTAPVLARLLGAGASMVGLAKLDQLAYSLVGNVGEGRAPLNPLYPERFTGGSSSGNASAVAGGLCDFGLGSDTAGSIRVPAAACGLFAIRPTHGLLDSTGALALAPSLDAVGILAREPLLLRDVFGALAPASSARSPRLTRVLLAVDCMDQLDRELVEAIEGVASLIAERCEVQIAETRLERFTDAASAELLGRVQAREIWATHSEWILANRSHLAPDVQARLSRAEQFAHASERELATDARAWARYREEHEQLTASGAAILMPVMAGLAPVRNASAEELQRFRLGALRWTAAASLTGSAQVVAPVRHAGSGLTYGVGLLGGRGADGSLLDALCVALGDRPGFTIQPS